MTQPGDLLDGRYRLDRRIGKGGMGEVWVATDERLGRTVAVKTVATDTPGDGADPSAADLARFQREAHATAGINHPNVVTVYDSGIDGSTAYLVMEYLPGGDLATLLRQNGPMPPRRALNAAAAVASGLAAAHKAGVIHRDIKPGNVMFDPQGTVKVVDFGIAALQHGGGNGTAAMTTAGTVLGSAPYLSPEQAEGYPATARSDLYALGCCLMAMLTGQPPFTGEHPLSLLRAHMDSAPPLVSERRPEISPEVDDLVDQLLAKDPRDRPGSATEVADRLTNLASGSVTAERPAPAPASTQVLTTGRPGRPDPTRRVPEPTRRVPVVARPVGEPDPLPEAVPATAAQPRRSSWVPWAVGGLLLALAGTGAAIGALMMGGDNPAPSTPAPVTTTTTTTSSTSRPAQQRPAPAPTSASSTPQEPAPSATSSETTPSSSSSTPPPAPSTTTSETTTTTTTTTSTAVVTVPTAPPAPTTPSAPTPTSASTTPAASPTVPATPTA